MSLAKVGVSAFALVAAAGVGAGMASPDPITVTEKGETVERVVEKRVEVAGPTVKVVPAACATAIKAAREVATVVVTFTDSSGKYPELVGRAFQAGLDQDMDEAESVIKTMNEANDGMGKANEALVPAVQVFNKAAEGCK